MPELLKESTVTARKAHRCLCCEAVAVHPGDAYERSTYIYDGRIYDWVSCAACRELTSAVNDWRGEPDEGVGADDYQEWAHEHVDDSVWGSQARAYLERRRGAFLVTEHARRPR